MQGIRFVGNVVLAWSLGPFARASFGLMSLVNIYVGGLSMLTDVGIVPGVVQSKRGDDAAFLNTAWTMQVYRGVIIGAIAAFLGIPLAWVYGEPMLALLMPFAGISTCFSALGSTRTITARRHLAIGRLTLCRIASRIVALFVGVTWALVSPSVWALIAMSIASAMTMTLLSHRALPGLPNRFGWDRDAARDLIRFGRWVMISSIITFAAMQADRMILGGLLSIELLGVYSVAYFLARVPRELIQSISGNVIFPAVSRYAELPRHELRRKILRNRAPILALMACVVAGLVATGDVIIRLIYPAEFAAGAWMLPVLAIGLWPRMLDATIAESLIALRKLQYNTISSLCRFILVAATLPIGFYFFGIAGAVIVVASGDVPNRIVQMYGLWREKLLSIKQDVWSTLLFIGLVLLFLSIRAAIGEGSPFDGMFTVTEATQAIGVEH